MVWTDAHDGTVAGVEALGVEGGGAEGVADGPGVGGGGVEEGPGEAVEGVEEEVVEGCG